MKNIDLSQLMESFQNISDQAGRINSIIKNIRNFVSASRLAGMNPAI